LGNCIISRENYYRNIKKLKIIKTFAHPSSRAQDSTTKRMWTDYTYTNNVAYNNYYYADSQSSISYNSDYTEMNIHEDMSGYSAVWVFPSSDFREYSHNNISIPKSYANIMEYSEDGTFLGGEISPNNYYPSSSARWSLIYFHPGTSTTRTYLLPIYNIKI